MTLGDLSVGDFAELNAGGDIVGGDLSAVNSLKLPRWARVQLGDLSGGSVNAVALTGDLTAGDVHAGDAVITAVGYTTLGDVTATDAAFLTSGIDLVAGDLAATNTLDVHVAGAADLNSISSKLMRITGTELNIAHITGVDVTMFSQGDLNLGDIMATGTSESLRPPAIFMLAMSILRRSTWMPAVTSSFRTWKRPRAQASRLAASPHSSERLSPEDHRHVRRHRRHRRRIARRVRRIPSC